MNTLRLLLSLLLGLLTLAAHAAPRYAITDLGTLPGYAESRATCLNNRSEVAGYVTDRTQHREDGQFYTRAFVWRKGRMLLLPTLPLSPADAPSGEKYSAVASGINNHGQIVGSLFAVFDGAWLWYGQQAVLWQNDALQKIPCLPDTNNNTAVAINDAGQVTGTAYEVAPSFSSAPHMFLFSNGSGRDIGPGCAMGMNANGQVCGFVLLDKDGAPANWIDSPDAPPRPAAQVQAVLCGAKQRQVLSKGYAFAVNRSGTVAGIQQGPEGKIVGNGMTIPALPDDIADPIRGHFKSGAVAEVTLWRTGQGRSRADALPDYWVPQALNDRGQMVNGHRLWQAGLNYDLNTLLPPNSNWNVVTATAINNRGWIVGNGTHNGKARAFLLTPQ